NTYQVREANLNKHLSAASRKSTEKKPDSKAITADNQLYEALNLLKGLKILSNKT
ncbi:MAG: peptidase S41, partial [Gammaproteobacteria bacterium]